MGVKIDYHQTGLRLAEHLDRKGILSTQSMILRKIRLCSETRHVILSNLPNRETLSVRLYNDYAGTKRFCKRK